MLQFDVGITEKEFMQRVCQWDKERRAKARENRPPRCTADNMTRPYEYSTARMSQFIAGESACMYECLLT